MSAFTAVLPKSCSLCEPGYARFADLPITFFAGVQEEVVKDAAAGIPRHEQLLRFGAEALVSIPVILIMLPAPALRLLWLLSIICSLAWNSSSVRITLLQASPATQIFCWLCCA